MRDRTRVLHLTYDMAVGGTEQVICQLVAGLDKAQYECSIACLESEIGLLGQQLQADGIEFHVLNRRPGFDWQLIRRLRRIVQSKKIDIIHCHQYTPYVYGVLASMMHRCKVVFTEHGRFYPDSYTWKRRALNPLLGSMTDSIVAISAATAAALAKFEWFRLSQISVIYNGTNAVEAVNRDAMRRSLGVEHDDIIFGTVTRFDPIKNLPMLIDAFLTVHSGNPQSRLLLVGDGEERQKIAQMVVDHDLSDAVIFVGYQADTDSFMAAIDVFVLCSFSEGTSMTLLEAMSCQTCCVVTDVGGNVEIIQHNENGMVVESGNTAQLADTLLHLAAEPEARARLGCNAHRTFSKKFELSVMIEQYNNTYQSIAQSQRLSGNDAQCQTR